MAYTRSAESKCHRPQQARRALAYRRQCGLGCCRFGVVPSLDLSVSNSSNDWSQSASLRVCTPPHRTHTWFDAVDARINGVFTKRPRMTKYDPMHMINRTASRTRGHALLLHCVCLWGLSGLSAGCASVEAPDSEPDAMTSQMPMGSPFPGQNQQTDSFFTMRSTDAGVFPSQPSGNNMNGDEQCEPFSRLGPCSFAETMECHSADDRRLSN